MAAETIRGAAMRLPRGTIYSSDFGHMRHGGLIAEMRELGESVGDIAAADQGFVTDQHRFVTRTEAMQIARAADQVRTTRTVDGIERTHVPTGDELFTEDLW